jgi:hypothetical protein
MDGTVELTVFPAVFRTAATLLRGRDALHVTGRVDDTDKGRVVLVEQVRLLENVLTVATPELRGPRCCRLTIRDPERAETLLPEVRAIAVQHAGAVPLFLHLWLPGQEVVVRAKETPVDATPAFVSELEAVLGTGAVLVE